ncbi:rRNA-processing protein [Elasticomyces elasticus]|nr:rRNA-processing protein [Elasticomyces elasticus]KAK4993318.1 rRNA-processing protein [Elasticomyces elasticus]
MSMITATSWVPRGFAAPFPTRYVFDEEEYERISKLAKLELNDAKEDLEQARQDEGRSNGTSVSGANADAGAEDEDEQVAADDDDLKEYDLEHYDDDPDGNPEIAEDGEAGTMSMFGNVKSLAYHASNVEDPYITLADNEDPDEEEREELQIMPSDNLVLAARVEDEVAHLEVYVYEDEADNLYVHHDIMLPAIPLAVEWLDMPVGKDAASKRADGKGNFVAIGTMDPDIEIWDLDTIDCMYPNAVLGQASDAAPSDPTTAKRKKKRKSKKINDHYHIDAVLSLAANRAHTHLLASASADTTIKLWDLNSCSCAKSYTHHTDKVCSLAWHPTESTVLVSGSYDRTVAAADMRAPDAKAPRWGVESDVEQVRWDPFDQHVIYVSTESGCLHAFDARNAPASPGQSKPIWTLQAHEKALSSFSLNPAVPGFIATGSMDKSVKLWNVSPSSGGPSMVVSRDLGLGKIFSVNFAPDDEVAFRLAVGGSKGAIQVWDTSTNKAIREAFAGRIAPEKLSVEKEERIVAVEQDESESSSDGEEDGNEGDVKEGADGWESMEE